MAKGSYNSPDKMSPTYSFGAYMCEVEVDLRTGEVTVLKMTVGHDCGRPLNPMSVEGQIEGCIQMGMGYALSENLIFEKGQTINPSFFGYKALCAKQMPQIDIHHVITEGRNRDCSILHIRFTLFRGNDDFIDLRVGSYTCGRSHQ